ncbi:hypothetical protein ACFOY4_41835 [Actinomadura syzygii]|uniref:hypothetical protein n=1 Tax=Actinomadura syzygii TaxID=1427538 RepID=UPI001CA303B2|nr:hypothetical protein [Actinomadura syzygii]
MAEPFLPDLDCVPPLVAGIPAAKFGGGDGGVFAPRERDHRAWASPPFLMEIMSRS